MTAPEVATTPNALLETALAPVAGDLKSLSEAILSYLPVMSRSGQEIAEHIFCAGGKRIRPALFLMASRLTGYRGPHLLPMAAVCEFVHTASLLHDDVVDNSTLRRNKPTANSIWGDESAVLVGDLVYSRASEIMAGTGSLDIVRSFAEAIRLMSEGELLQLDNIFDADLSEDGYLDVIYKKTAALISAACRAAGVLADVTAEQLQALSDYGTAVGITFQIVDDCLDYVTSSEHLGKPILADLTQGKMTLPLILLMQAASEDDRAFLRSLFKKRTHSEVEIDRVRGLLEVHDAVSLCLTRASSHSERALDALKAFPDSSARQDMEAIVGYLCLRKS